MKTGEIKIIDERFVSGSPAASWDEYLVLEKLEDGRFKLDIRVYEVLTESGNYFDEEKDDYVLPAQIDGKNVVGLIDEYVIGGDLVQMQDDTPEITFKIFDQEILSGWLKMIGWSNEDIFKSLVKECRNA
jgi:hypothetical protein